MKPDDDAERHQPEQRAERVRREQHAHAASVPTRELVRAGRRARARSAASGARPARRAPPARGTREPGAPAEVEVLGAGEGRGVEAPELREEVGAHEHRGGGDVEDVAHAVVLLLVDLAGLDAGVRRAEAVDGAADLEQDLGVVGAHELGPEDPRVRPVAPPRPGVGSRRVEHDVVVAEEEERSRPPPRAAPRWRPRRSRRSRRPGARTRAAARSATRGVGSSSEPQSTTSTVRSA